MLTGKEYPKEEFSSVVVQLGFGGEDVPLDDSLTFEQEGALGPNKVAHFDELNTWTQSGTSSPPKTNCTTTLENSSFGYSLPVNIGHKLRP